MRASLTITPPKWMRDNDVRMLMQALNHDGVNALFVGGCIRNDLMNKTVQDVDIACKFTPSQTIETLQKSGIKTIPTGIAFGTITAIINGQSFEITSLRSDNNTDGRHADVSFGADWHQDAKRRDFTINALYADMDGKIYDPLGSGLDDIQTKTVRFIGDAPTRIHEDYLRILRFFRFNSQYGSDTPHEPSFEACKHLAQKINTLSRERICDELTKIIAHKNAAHAFSMMKQASMFELDDKDIYALDSLIQLQNQLEADNTNARIHTIKTIENYFNNNKLKSFSQQLDRMTSDWNKTPSIHYALYMFGREITTQGLLVLKSQGHIIDDTTIVQAMTNTIPTLPVTATDIMTHLNIEQGPAVGKHLKTLEKLWLDNPKLKTLDLLSRL